jgi:hypothetical protein
MHIRLTPKSEKKKQRSGRHLHLRGDASFAIPEWTKPLVGTMSVWTGNRLLLSSLRAASAELVPHALEERSDPVQWTRDSQEGMDVDLTLPLLILARDLEQLGDIDGDLFVEA